MPSRRRTLTALGAALLLFAVTALIGFVGHRYRTTDNDRSTAAGAGVAAGAPGPAAQDEDHLQRILLTKDEHPAGTVMTEVPLAAADPEEQIDPNVTVSSKSCLFPLQQTISEQGGVATGWLQLGSRRGGDQPPEGKFSAAVGSLPGGLNLARLREVAATCATGTMTWQSPAVTATIVLSEVPVPTLEGADTYGQKSTITFTGATQEQFEAVMDKSCELELAPPPGEVAAARYNCRDETDTHLPVNHIDGAFVVEQHQVWVASGDYYLEVCEVDLDNTIAMSKTLYDRLRAHVQ